MVPPTHPREDEILDRWAAGESSGVIGARLCELPAFIRAIVHRARERGDPRADVREAVERLSHNTPPEVRRIMRLEARARGLSHVELIERLFDAICRDNLFKAILDD